jgi:hypothetical protein
MIFSRASMAGPTLFVAGHARAVNFARRDGVGFDPPGRAWDTSVCSMIKHTVRLGRVVVGAVLLLVGFIMALPLVPGPGLLLVVIGLGFLSHEFEWARRLRDRAHAEFERLARRRHVG